MANDRNAVSVWFWMLAIVVTALPCIGTAVALLLAFAGDNETRKNYFKAVLLLQVLAIAFVILVHALGFGAVIVKTLRDNGWNLPR